MSAGKITAIVIGALLALVGLALLLPGAFLLWAQGTQRDDDGFYLTDSRPVSTNSYALTSPNVDLHLGPLTDWLPRGDSAAVRIRAASTGSTPVFVGIGPSARVSSYLGNVAYDQIDDFGWSGNVDHRRVTGAGAPSPPGDETFWVAQQEGTGTQTLDWDVEDGDWTAVVMNADASRRVSADLSLGARFGLLLPLGIGLTVGGAILLVTGVVLIVLGARPSRSPAAVTSSGTMSPNMTAAAAQPPQATSPGPQAPPVWTQPEPPPPTAMPVSQPEPFATAPGTAIAPDTTSAPDTTTGPETAASSTEPAPPATQPGLAPTSSPPPTGTPPAASADESGPAPPREAAG